MSGRVKGIAFIGHSFGALFGGILSSVDKRFKALILMAGVGSFTDVARLNVPNAALSWLDAYHRTMDPIDPINYIGAAGPASLLFQFGRQDAFFPHTKFEEYFQAASEPKEIRWYDADHYSLNQAGRSDRIEWLERKMVHH